MLRLARLLVFVVAFLLVAAAGYVSCVALRQLPLGGDLLDLEGRESIRRGSEKLLEDLHRKNAGRPVEEWSPEDRACYDVARRRLRELDGR